jgi:hypothetical protein
MTIRSIASYSNRRGALGLALVLILLAQVAFMPDRWQTFRELLPYLAQPWGSEAKMRLALARGGADLYDFLMLCDRLLPRQATLLLVTGGAEDYGRAYFIYNRSLYHPYPRRVWWAASFPVQGSPAWWIPSDLTPESLRRIVAQVGADYIVAYDMPSRPPLGIPVAEFAPDQYILDVQGLAR